jgi:hypothetical protein
MFCERIQRSCSCLPHSQWTSLGMQTVLSIDSYFKLDVNKTTYFTKNSIGSWPNNTNASHEIVPFLRYISPMTNFKTW